MKKSGKNSPAKLNLGCGMNHRVGYVNLDAVKLPGVDIVHDLSKTPYPFKDNQFEEILCQHLLEHLDNFEGAMKEIHRILKPGGIVKITVPHFSGSGAWTDPQHKRPFGYYSFEYFIKNPDYEPAKSYSHEMSTKFSRIAKRKLVFGKSIQIWNWIIEPIANKFPHVYEDSFLRVFPVLEMYVELEK